MLIRNHIDHELLCAAIDLSRRCPRSTTAYSVGAIVADASGNELASGYSREGGPADHAEETALARLPRGIDLRHSTIYSSLEPCSTRRSKPHSCTQLILAAGIGRVVFALREPLIFADCRGAETLCGAGVQVIEMPELAGSVRHVNGIVLTGSGQDRSVAASPWVMRR
jgi:diaminohydroxyphosphoribosylaminopyrimidine deaminase/5-amino-6-(5-phosphoribosylamino)uracil reductase